MTFLPLHHLGPEDGWCDAPDDPQYNKLVELPYPASAEKMWKEEHVYDIVVVIGYNDRLVMPGKGSAIFLHVARPDFSPTEGCVALAMPDLIEVLEVCSESSVIHILEK